VDKSQQVLTSLRRAIVTHATQWTNRALALALVIGLASFSPTFAQRGRGGRGGGGGYRGGGVRAGAAYRPAYSGYRGGYNYRPAYNYNAYRPAYNYNAYRPAYRGGYGYGYRGGYYGGYPYYGSNANAFFLGGLVGAGLGYGLGSYGYGGYGGYGYGYPSSGYGYSGYGSYYPNYSYSSAYSNPGSMYGTQTGSAPYQTGQTYQAPDGRVYPLYYDPASGQYIYYPTSTQ
jgi:hypothetical protein